MRVSYKMRFRPTKNDDDENLLAFFCAREWRWMRLNGDDTYTRRSRKEFSQRQKNFPFYSMKWVFFQLSAFSLHQLFISRFIWFIMNKIHFDSAKEGTSKSLISENKYFSTLWNEKPCVEFGVLCVNGCSIDLDYSMHYRAISSNQSNSDSAAAHQ